MSLPKWTNQRRNSYRRADGNWNGKKLRPIIQKYRSEGHTLTEISAMTGVSKTTLNNCLRHAERGPDTGIIAAHLARELGVSQRGMTQHLETHGIPTTRFGRKYLLTEEDAEKVRAYYLNTLTENEAASPDWVTINQAAALFGIRTVAMAQRLSGGSACEVRRKRIRGVTGNKWRYYLPDLQRVKSALPIALTTPPVGVMSACAVAELLDIHRFTVTIWIRRGAPHVSVAAGKQVTPYFHPAQLSAWLIASPYPVRRSLGRTLAHLTAKGTAA